MAAAPMESLRTAIIALVANLGITAAKLVAALVTGSSAMLAEAFHGFADSGNEVLLIVADRRGESPPDERHPLGHGRGIVVRRVAYLVLAVSLVLEGISFARAGRQLGAEARGLDILIVISIRFT